VANLPTIVVCGATGQQGACVVDGLLARKRFRVVAFSRQPQGAKAQRLRAKGVVVQSADLADLASLERVFQGAQGVFGVTQPWTADYRRADVAGELKQGMNIIDACLRARISHLVLSTVMNIDDKPTDIPHVASKIEIERYLFGKGVPSTLLRPGTFMDNIGMPFFPVKPGRVRGFTDGDAKLPFVSCHDIGEAAAVAFETPDQWIGKQVNLVSDYVSGEDICEMLQQLRAGERFRYSTVPRLLMRLFAPEFYKMRRGFEQVGRPPFPQQSKIDEALTTTRRMVPGFWTVGRYLAAAGFAGGDRPPPPAPAR
jgi:uncharacterized protein YbjT (DUF2867 family)